MHVFEIVLVLLLGGAALTAVARRLSTPYPALVALAGACLALIPGVPTLNLDPELALVLFVAPVLLDTAFDSSQRDLRRNWRPISSLALGAVALTVVVVALVARTLVPDMPWAAAIALGAIVAPPDAAAATAVLRQLRPPHRLLIILEGESLFNDVSALLIYRLAVNATLVGAVSGWSIIPTLLLVTGGSVVLALVLARVLFWINRRVQDVPTAVIVQFCGTFGIWILAEQLHLSGILTMVISAMAMARMSGAVTPARLRIPSYAVWEVVVFVLNILAFILVGFQLQPIIASLDRAALDQYLWVAIAVCGAAIGARIVWVMGAAAFSRWFGKSTPFGDRKRTDQVALSPAAAMIVGWCGMRGIVTLAAALALPSGGEGGASFPYRDLILFTAFAVVLGTLVVQGMTLRPLILAFQLRDDGAIERETQLARVETLRASLDSMSTMPGEEIAALVRQRYEIQLRHAQAEQNDTANNLSDDQPNKLTDQRVGSHADADAIRAALDAARHRLVALRADGTIGDGAFQQIEQELDWEELDFQQLMRE